MSATHVHGSPNDMHFIGRIDIGLGTPPANGFRYTLNPNWVRLGLRSGIGFSFEDYYRYVDDESEELVARMCVVYSDASSSQSASKPDFRIRLRRIVNSNTPSYGSGRNIPPYDEQYDAGHVFMEDSFMHTWSGAQQVGRGTSTNTAT